MFKIKTSVKNYVFRCCINIYIIIHWEMLFLKLTPEEMISSDIITKCFTFYLKKVFDLIRKKE